MKKIYFLALLTFSTLNIFGQVPTNGLVAYYPFNGNADDESGNNNNVIVDGAILETDRFGIQNGAYYFDGINDKIYKNVGSSFSSSEITISLWAKIRGTGNINPRFVAVGPNGTSIQHYGLILEGTSSSRRIWFYTGGSVTNSYSNSFVQNENIWKNYLVTIKNNTVKIYINGTLDKETTVTGSLSIFSNAKLQIGYSDNDLDWFNGTLDDIRIYNRAISDNEVQALYQAEAPPIDITTGLIAHYKMDGNANDASGNGNHGTQQGGVNFTTAIDRFGVAGKAAGFDGVDDEILINKTFGGNQELTISAWVKTNVTSSNIQAIVSSTDDTFSHFQISDNPAHRNVIFSTIPGIGGFGASLPTIPAIPINQWNFYAVRYKSGSSKVYKNGVETSASNEIFANIISTNILKIGNGFANNRFLNGSLDDIRIYNRALTDTEVQALYQAEAPPIDITTGLVAHYKLDGNAQDASGNGNHGTQQGDVNFTTVTDRFGNIGKAAGFDGVNDYISIPNSPALQSPNPEITLSTWFKSNTTNYSILCKGGNSTNSLQYRIQGNDNSLSFIFNGSVCDFTGLSITTMNWNNIIIKSDGTTNKLFINGLLIKTQGFNSTYPNNQILPLEIGRDVPGATEYYGGLMDDIRIYNRALSDVEVANLYKFESEGIVEIKPSTSLKITPIIIPIGGNKYLEGSGFATNSTISINITRTTPGLPISPIITNSDNQGKFSGILLPNNDVGASFRVVASDASGNSAVINYNTSDNTNYAILTYPFKGSIIQANASGANTVTLKWNDKINLTNSVANGGTNRTVTYVINYKAFTDVDWSEDVIRTKTLPFGNNDNITDNLTLPGIGTYSIRVRHQNVSELWNITDNITIQAGDNIQVSYYNKRFVSSNAIKGIIADGISRMQINCILPNGLPIKRVIVTLQDPIANKTSKEILGVLADGRNLTETQVEANDYNPTFNISTTFSNIQNRAWSMWYIAPTDFSDGTAFFGDKVRNVKLRFEIVYDQNGTEVSEIKNHDVQIARPPLMMLGGIGLPATDTWEKFNSYMTNYGQLYMYPLEQGIVNYNPGGDANGSSSFAANALMILSGNNETYGKKGFPTVRKIMTDLGFVCSRVDVLTHGMGASVVHASMLLNGGASYLKYSDTYDKGYVNKLISLNAEKNGTPLVDLVEALLKEVNKNPITSDDVNQALDFMREFKVSSNRQSLLNGIKTGASVKGVILSRLTTRFLIYYTLANIELPFVGHLIKRVPRKFPVPPIANKDDFLNELGSIPELTEWYEKLPNTFSSLNVNNWMAKYDELQKLPDLSKLNIVSKAKNLVLSSVDYGGAYLGYYLKSDSLVVSEAANELRNNETDIFNRTLLSPVPLANSGIHYLVGDLVGGNQENFITATDFFVEKNEYVEKYSKLLEAIGGVFEKVDELSDYKFIAGKTQYQTMRSQLSDAKDKDKLYAKWNREGRLPNISDQNIIKKIQGIIKLFELPILVFNYVKTGSDALSFAFNSDGIATTASQAATNTIQGLNASSVTRFPSSFNNSNPFEGVINYNYFSMPSNFTVYSKIKDLLNSSINSNLFVKTISQPFYGPSGFNPFGPPTNSIISTSGSKDSNKNSSLSVGNSIFIKNLVDTSAVKIVKPLANSSLSVGAKMEVRVNLKDTTNFSQLELSFQGEKYYQVEKTKNSVFYINIEPSEDTELLQVTAKYKLGIDSSLHISDRLRVTPINTESIQKITPLQEIIYVKKGQLFSQSCFLSYPSYETYIAADTRFIFNIANSGIISFDNTTGLFKALQIGTTEVTGTYKNISFHFVVIVEDLPLSIVPVTIYNNACLGRNINISLIKNGFFDVNTNYFVELSDATGNFTNPVSLYTGKNLENQTITLPNGILEGDNYQIRIRTDLPNYVSAENIVLSLHNDGILKSVKSGYWIDPSTWSCSEIPTTQSKVIIKTPHKVELLPNETGKAKSIDTENGAVLELKNGSVVEIKN